MDEELGRLVVINKMVCEYSVYKWYFYYIAIFNVLCHVLKLYSVINIFVYLFVYLYMITFHICLLSIHSIDISYCCI